VGVDLGVSPLVHNPARRGVFSSAEPADSPLALIADCVAIAFALLCATGWPFAWIAEACR
jgi:hypothetical protein